MKSTGLDLQFSLQDQLKALYREAWRDRDNLNRPDSSLISRPNRKTWVQSAAWLNLASWMKVEDPGSSISWSTLELRTSKNTTLIDICSTPLRKPFLTRAFINLVIVWEGNTFQNHIFLPFYNYRVAAIFPEQFQRFTDTLKVFFFFINYFSPIFSAVCRSVNKKKQTHLGKDESTGSYNSHDSL